MFDIFLENVLFTLIVCGSGFGLIFTLVNGLVLIGVVNDLCRLNKLKKEDRERYELINLMVNFLYKNELCEDERDRECLYLDFLAFNEGNLFKKLTQLQGHLAYVDNLNTVYEKYTKNIIEGIFCLIYDDNFISKDELIETLNKLEEMNLYCETSLYLSLLLQNCYAVKKLDKRILTKEEYKSYSYIKDCLTQKVNHEETLKTDEQNSLLKSYLIQSHKLNKYIQSCLLERV